MTLFMKKTCTIAALALIACGLILTGCTTPKRTAYKSLAAIGMTVSKAMDAAADAKVAGKITAEEWSQVAAKYDDFRIAYSTACDLAGQDYTAWTPADLLLMEVELIRTINAIAANHR